MASVKHSEVLFIDECGRPMRFYLQPGLERKRIKPLIENGGGIFSKTINQHTIKLADPSRKVHSDDHISIKFIDDCVEANKLLNPRKYRVKNESRNYDSDSDLEPAKIIIGGTAKSKNGRKGYNIEEDREMIEYIVKNRRLTDIGGNAVFKEMERAEVTCHPWQSMRTRFTKQILPNIKGYKIPPQDLAYITGGIYVPNDNSDTASKDTIEDEGSPNDQIETEEDGQIDIMSLEEHSDAESCMEIDDFDEDLIRKASERTECESPAKNKGSQKNTPQRKSPRKLSHKKSKSDTSSNYDTSQEFEKNTPQKKTSTRLRKASSCSSCSYSSKNVKDNTCRMSKSGIIEESKPEPRPRKEKKSPDTDTDTEKNPNQKMTPQNKNNKAIAPSSSRRASIKQRLFPNESDKALTSKAPDTVISKELNDTSPVNPAKKRRYPLLAFLNDKDTNSDFSEPQENTQDENCQETLAPQVEEAVKTFEEVQDWLELTPNEVLHVLHLHNGNLSDALEYILGKEKDKPLWNAIDDNILLNGNKKNYQQLEQKYGEESIHQRLHYLVNEASPNF